ncbi:MAG TPA: arsenite methyltransferase [Flavobacteriales bacterium]|nr:arsenite methyltransferase [Flavobacteriales bacterium]MCC6840801.1 arsenite methyltransferase [Flavobacteriales bacterium]HNE80022.1 arsenite methyltransferase [Flavobacteriales bacterium]HNI04368.1 arsenite methyltransferase [Flavobacteriales bacterium]HNK40706.1 arsenite methyltransferase [Flavobacteriales bacterium]
MKTPNAIKQTVRAKYAEIAQQDRADNAASCCGSGGCSTEVYNIMTDDYSKLEGHVDEADLGLGCGLPTQFAGIKPGDTVLDLGSGAGNDCFVARHEAGPDGRVIGVDFTPEMIAKARANAQQLGYANVEFREGDIEQLPLSDAMVDVVVSNCVLNLVPDKKKAFSEIFRVLKPGGHFSISDVVLQGELPDALQHAAEMYAGCVSGAMQESDYLGIIHQLGFGEVTVQKRKAITLPDDILANFLNAGELAAFKASGTGIFSITVSATKPEVKAAKEELKAACCGSGSACC